MAEEDILFGKNRHLFGGIAPSNMLRFTAKRDNANNRVMITCELPTETVVDGQVICTVAGAVIRKSTTGYPETEFDGALLADVTSDGTIYDTNVESGTVYYYSAFPYSKMGVYNRNKTNRASVGNFAGTYLFGYDLDTTDKNPSTRVSYPEDVDNAEFASARMDYSAGVFDYGDWTSTPGEYFMPKPCMLNGDGTVYEYLNPNDYSKKEDGTSISSGTYYTMMEWPKIYTKRWKDDDGIYHFRCSDIKVDDDYECWCNYDIHNNEIDHFYTAVYHCGSAARSRAGEAINTSTSISSYFTKCENLGEAWSTECLADRLLIQDLLVLMGKSTDAQTVYGMGYTSGSTYIENGTLSTAGLFWGSNDTTSGVKVFGMENYWGNCWRVLSGWTTQGGLQRVKITKGTYDGTTATDFNLTGDGYNTSLMSSTKNNISGYGNYNIVTPYGRFTKTANGSSSTYECDNVEIYGSDYGSSTCIAIVGGWSNLGVSAGLFNVWLIKDSSTTGVTAFLACKPSAT